MNNNIQEKITTLRTLLSSSPKNSKEIIKDFILSDSTIDYEEILDILQEVFKTVNDSYIDSVIEFYIEKFNRIKNIFAFSG